MDKDKGFLGDAFEQVLRSSRRLAAHKDFDKFVRPEHFKQAMASDDEECERSEVWPRLPGSSDTGDPYGYLVKPNANSKWTKPPMSDEDKALYYGVHIHTESNPLGLHTHNPGGPLEGGHTHGPQNRFGEHTHTGTSSIDGKHTHEGKHYPDGCHEHRPEHFG